MIIFGRKFNEKLDSKFQPLFTKFIENEMLSLRNLVIPSGNKSIAKNHFLLFNYDKHFPKFSHLNLGDYIQTLAVKNALSTLFPSATYQFHDRDSLSSFCAGGGGGGKNLVNALIPVIMQGWFAHSSHFFPNNQTLPIFVGTHFASGIHKFLEYFIAYYPFYFKDKEIGCRDLETLQFCQNKGLKAYFSRCLTLTLPKREANIEANKVFLVGIPKEYLQYIPQNLSDNAIQINQQNIEHQNLNSEHFESQAQNLLETYKNEAKLIITCALHCASPAIAMGIPVVLIARDQENIQRFSALSGIVPIYTLEDLEKGRVDFAPQSLNIELLKEDMLENLKLSIKQAMGESIDTQALQAIRQRIADFVPAMQSNAAESQGDSVILSGGGG